MWKHLQEQQSGINREEEQITENTFVSLTQNNFNRCKKKIYSVHSLRQLLLLKKNKINQLNI